MMGFPALGVIFSSPLVLLSLLDGRGFFIENFVGVACSAIRYRPDGFSSLTADSVTFTGLGYDPHTLGSRFNLPQKRPLSQGLRSARATF